MVLFLEVSRENWFNLQTQCLRNLFCLGYDRGGRGNEVVVMFEKSNLCKFTEGFLSSPGVGCVVSS